MTLPAASPLTVCSQRAVAVLCVMRRGTRARIECALIDQSPRRRPQPPEVESRFLRRKNMSMRPTAPLLAALALGSLAQAQTKISGTVQCGKPDKEFSIPVEGAPGHAYSISHGACTWIKPMEIAGSKTKA